MTAAPPADDALFAELLALVAPFGQQHVLDFWSQLGADEKFRLAGQIRDLDLSLIAAALADQSAGPVWEDLAAQADSPTAIRLHDPQPRWPRAEAVAAGKAALRSGQVGVILVAGGQGTRLGFDHPKGLYPVGPVTGATLFQILLEKVLATARRYRSTVPLAVMTSEATAAETREYLESQAFFGLPAQDVTIFQQGAMPAVDCQTGKLLLESPSSLALSPDGHGGMVLALARQGLLKQWRERGVAHLFYMQVDNPLCTVCDPEFIGYHLLAQSEMSTQVVAKTAPLDRVGNLVQINGRAQIIEYSDLPAAAAQRRRQDGSLLFWAGNVAVHALAREFLERVSADADALAAHLPLHRARKKVPFIDGDGNRCQPSEPNAVKFERFIFDLLPQARNALAVEVEPAVAFAPLKNAPGSAKDAPEHVRLAISQQGSNWLRDCGLPVPYGTVVEISPLAALFAADLAAMDLSAADLAGKSVDGAAAPGPIYIGPGRNR